MLNAKELQSVDDDMQGMNIYQIICSHVISILSYEFWPFERFGRKLIDTLE